MCVLPTGQRVSRPSVNPGYRVFRLAQDSGGAGSRAKQAGTKGRQSCPRRWRWLSSVFARNTRARRDSQISVGAGRTARDCSHQFGRRGSARNSGGIQRAAPDHQRQGEAVRGCSAKHWDREPQRRPTSRAARRRLPRGPGWARMRLAAHETGARAVASADCARGGCGPRRDRRASFSIWCAVATFPPAQVQRLRVPSAGTCSPSLILRSCAPDWGGH